MSYEGHEEYLCTKGHYWTVDAMTMMYGEDDERKRLTTCPFCGDPAEYHCRVDETNGYYPDVPDTFGGPKEEVGFDDIPQQDHHGNKYFTKLHRYAPVLKSGRWNKIEE